jgi:hypothetical protein
MFWGEIGIGVQRERSCYKLEVKKGKEKQIFTENMLCIET